MISTLLFLFSPARDERLRNLDIILEELGEYYDGKVLDLI